MTAYHANQLLRHQISELRNLRDELSTIADHYYLSSPNNSESQTKLKQIGEDDERIKKTLTSLAKEYHSAFHPIWGMMFQAGYQDSRLAYFVANYACLYTAKATNLGLVSTQRAFRTTGDILPHDQLLSLESS